jgi:ATP/maltotriose-dependent transcriptional regulator MalT
MLIRQATELNGQRRPGPALRSIEALKSIEGWDATGMTAFFTLISEAQIREECGELDRCLRLYDEVMQRLEESPDLSHLAAHVHLGRAGILMKRFFLDEAAAALDLGRPLIKGQPGTVDAGFLINEVEMYLCTGAAEAGLAQLRPLSSVTRLHYGSAHYLLDLDRLGGADDEVRGRYKELCEMEGLGKLTSEELMLYARFSPRDPSSFAHLDDALARMRADGYVSRLVDTLLLKASRTWPQDMGAAHDSLREAMHYSVPEGLIMPFVVENELSNGLLQETAADTGRTWSSRDKAFLRKVMELRARRATPAAPVADGQSMQLRGEKLTEREREVLSHMALGESNAQIAAALFVSLPTVKTHVASILSKLGAARRTEAIERARRQGLLTAER